MPSDWPTRGLAFWRKPDSIYSFITVGWKMDSREAIEDTVKIIDAISRFFAGVGWPLVVIVAVVCLAPALRDLIMRIETLKGNIAGNELALTLQTNSANQIVAAKSNQLVVEAKKTPSNPIPNVNNLFRTTLDQALATTTRIQVERTIGRQVLWVDDNPTNNISEKQALVALGMTIKDATSTDAAMGLLRGQHFDLIISDMRRGDNPTAGYDLLQKAREAGIAAPLIFYTASANDEVIAQAKQRGAFGETNSPVQLVALAASALGAN
jgi:CheY-like chemotaxis protein